MLFDFHFPKFSSIPLICRFSSPGASKRLSCKHRSNTLVWMITQSVSDDFLLSTLKSLYIYIGACLRGATLKQIFQRNVVESDPANRIYARVERIYAVNRKKKVGNKRQRGRRKRRSSLAVYSAFSKSIVRIDINEPTRYLKLKKLW